MESVRTMNACIFLMHMLIFCFSFKRCHGKQNTCVHTLTPQFHECAISNHSTYPDNVCKKIYPCTKRFNISFVRIEPTETFKDIVGFILHHCCGTCTNTTELKTLKINEVNASSINTSDLVFPILGSASTDRLYGYHFLPTLNVPGGFYITEKRSDQEILRRLVKSCGNLWPLLVIMLLLSVIVGFVVWVMETWVNKEEFSRSFFVGLFDGFWWSFISMTTVGYGDKTPKFIVSRLFSVIWILVGITICSMFTASLTTELTSALSPDIPDMEGAKVGVLRYRLFDARLIASHGGTLHETEDSNVIQGVLELISRLRGNEIDGFLLDRYTYMYVKKTFSTILKESKSDYKDEAEFFLRGTIPTKQITDGDKMAYGILVKTSEDREFFKEFVRNNKDFLETCKRLKLNALNEKDELRQYSLFDPSAGYFFPMLIGTVSGIAVLCCLGVIYELCRKAHRKLANEADKNKNTTILLNSREER